MAGSNGTRWKRSGLWIGLLVSIVALGIGTLLVIPQLEGDKLIAATATVIAAVISALVGTATVASSARQQETEQLRLKQQFQIEQTRLKQEKAIEEYRLGRQATISAIKYLSGESSKKLQTQAALMTMCKLGDVGIALLTADELEGMDLAAHTRLVLLALESGESSRRGPALDVLQRLSPAFGRDELKAFASLINAWPPEGWDSGERWLFVNYFFDGLTLKREAVPSNGEMAWWTDFAAIVLRSADIQEQETALAVLRACEPYKEEWEWSEYTGFPTMQEYFGKELGKKYGPLTTPHAETRSEVAEQAAEAWWKRKEVAKDPEK